jgi:hypothetical protein
MCSIASSTTRELNLKFVDTFKSIGYLQFPIDGPFQGKILDWCYKMVE